MVAWGQRGARVNSISVFSHIASGARGEFNHRNAQPTVTDAVGFSNLPPFDTTALLGRQRRLGGVPKTIFTNSAWEGLVNLFEVQWE